MLTSVDILDTHKDGRSFNRQYTTSQDKKVCCNIDQNDTLEVSWDSSEWQ